MLLPFALHVKVSQVGNRRRNNSERHLVLTESFRFNVAGANCQQRLYRWHLKAKLLLRDGEGEIMKIAYI